MKTPDRNLRQKDTSTLDIGKEALDDAVAKTDQHQKCQKRIFRRCSRYADNGERLTTEGIKVDIHADNLTDEVFGKGVLQIDRKAEELHRYDREKVYGEKSV